MPNVHKPASASEVARSTLAQVLPESDCDDMLVDEQREVARLERQAFQVEGWWAKESRAWQ